MINAVEKKLLRSQGQRLPVKADIGKNGWSDAASKNISTLLEHHPLLKIRIRIKDREARQEMLTTICQQTQAIPIALIGQSALIFKEDYDGVEIS